MSFIYILKNTKWPSFKTNTKDFSRIIEYIILTTGLLIGIDTLLSIITKLIF